MGTAAETPTGELRCDVAAIRGQLERVLSSPQFRNSKRSQALLRFVAESALEDRLDDLREKIIGFRVFGRDVAYDTSHDAIVRCVATEVRKRLAQYYLEEGHNRELRIELPAGSYVPSFTVIGEEAETTIEDSVRAAEPKPVAGRNPFPRKPLLRVAIGVALFCLIVAFAYLLIIGRGSRFDRFWAPMFATHESVQIVVGQPIRSYRFVGPRQWELEALYKPNAQTESARKALHPLIAPDEISWNADRYFYQRDAYAMTRLGGLVHAKGGKYRLMHDTETNFLELRGSPAIVIGAFNNAWTQRLGSETRFSLGRRVVDGVAYNCVADRNEPNAKKWMIPRNSSMAESEDYAIVTRVMDRSTERTAILVAGFRDAGTQAASEFVTDPAYMNAALRTAPRGWEKRNIQLVLRTKIIAGAPGPAELVAVHFW